MARRKMWLCGDAEADELLSKSDLALVIGMVLDQQFPIERAFAAPKELERRLGHPLDAADLAAMNPEKLSELFTARPALHRYPGSMAGRVQAVCQIIATDYDNDTAKIWKKAQSGAELNKRLKALPGFGEQKAKIFGALLGKQLGVTPEGWEASFAPYSEPGSHRSVADITSAESLAQVRAFKQDMKKKAKAAAAS